MTEQMINTTDIIKEKTKRGRPPVANPIWKNKEHNSVYFNSYYATKGIEKHTCGCGKEYVKHHKARHEKSVFHHKFLLLKEI